METSTWQDLIPAAASLPVQVAAFLRAYGRTDTLAHVEGVAKAARSLAEPDGPEMMERAERAGWLHDISAVIPAAGRLEMARLWGVPILPEEEALPMLLHQQLSAVIARQWFGVQDEGVLSAIAVHTTLRPGASRLDKIVFLADKIAWDQPGTPPFLEGVRAGLDHSLEDAARFYLEYLSSRLGRPLHPWAAAALAELRG